MIAFPEKITTSVKAKLEEPAIALQFQDNQSLGLSAPPADAGLPNFEYDAVTDGSHRISRGIIRKYRNRILLIANSHCAVHCRYCFRQHYDYANDTFQEADLNALVTYLAVHTEIDEVILSGGDPLMLSNRRLNTLISTLYQQPTLKRIRIHSRVITVLSKRINPELLNLWQRYRSKLVIVTHINHAAEIDEEAVQTLAKIRDIGITLLNQSVLLKGVNDQVSMLSALSDRLFELGIMPYYLNLLDRVKGAEHFYIPDSEAQAIYHALAKQTSGYLLPKLVRDNGEAPYKQILGLA